MLIVHVNVVVKDGQSDAFIEATLKNCQASIQEVGIIRFDLIRNLEDPNRFLLQEIYRDKQAPLAHKETEHYASWRDAVADMMAEPRSSVKFEALYPATAAWEVSAN